MKEKPFADKIISKEYPPLRIWVKKKEIIDHVISIKRASATLPC